MNKKSLLGGEILKFTFLDIYSKDFLQTVHNEGGQQVDLKKAVTFSAKTPVWASE